MAAGAGSLASYPAASSLGREVPLKGRSEEVSLLKRLLSPTKAPLALVGLVLLRRSINGRDGGSTSKVLDGVRG